MTLRRHIVALVAVLLAPAFASAASYDTANFSTEAPTAELAKKFGDMAEFYRKEKALEWTGKEMPQWHRRCPLQVQITQGSAGGATTFTFGQDGGRSVVASIRMEIRGDAKQLLHSVLPHEVTHTVLANYFGRPVPRWADEGGSVLSENDEERFNHNVRCRELLNAGRGIRCRVLFQMTEYPRDMIVLYAQGYSVSHYLVAKGGDGKEGRLKLLQFLAIGMSGTDPRDRGRLEKKYHGSQESWNEAASKMYGFDTIDALEEAWLTSLKAPPARVAARDTTPPAGLTSATGTPRTELRTSAAPGVPLLEPPVRAVRGTAPDREPSRPTY
ncbi:MAG TPA: hypothetical protein VGE74_18055, partial [Gemmata sp.]